MTLPDVCRHGSTPFEKKLLLYLDSRPRLPFELFYPDSSLYAEEHLPELEGECIFIPLWEMQRRLFLFELREDRVKVRKHFKTIDPTPRSKKRERKKRNRRPRRKNK